MMVQRNYIVWPELEHIFTLKLNTFFFLNFLKTTSDNNCTSFMITRLEFKLKMGILCSTSSTKWHKVFTPERWRNLLHYLCVEFVWSVQFVCKDNNKLSRTIPSASVSGLEQHDLQLLRFGLIAYLNESLILHICSHMKMHVKKSTKFDHLSV